MIIKTHAALLFVSFIALLAAISMARDQRVGGERLVGKVSDNPCVFSVEGMDEGAPWRLVYEYERWSGQSVPELAVQYGGASWVVKQRDGSSARVDGYYPSTGNYGLVEYRSGYDSLVVSEVGPKPCKGKALYLRKNASDLYQYISAAAIYIAIYALVAMFVIGATRFFRHK